LLFHRVRFLQGDAYHSLGNKGMEDEAYEDAERVRRELLLSKHFMLTYQSVADWVITLFFRR
jgi:hypothetical protein